MDLTPNHKLKDFVRIDRGTTLGKFERTPHFPEIVKDEYENYVGIVTFAGEEINDPMVAFMLDLMKWGATRLERYNVLKNPLKEGEVLDVPEHSRVPHEIIRNFSPTRKVRDFFEFSMELPPGLKWSEKNEKKRVKSNKNFSSPTLCVGNRGYTSVYSPPANGNGFDAACIGAIRMGFMLTYCDNGVSNIEVDDSKEQVAFLKGRMAAPDFVKVVKDFGWEHDDVTSRSSRGINDFNRIVTFERQPTADEMRLYKELLALDKCPGWTGITESLVPNTVLTYRFRTCWDSSD
jgi:hypothetical protein